MIKDELTERIRAAFSVEPLPEEYWRDGVDLSGDIPEELSARIVRRPWRYHRLDHDWRSCLDRSWVSECKRFSVLLAVTPARRPT